MLRKFWHERDKMDKLGKIHPLTVGQLSEYTEVIRESFTTVAKDYGLTKENCPYHWSFATNERMAGKIKDGYYPFGCFAGKKLVGFVALTDYGEGVYEMGILSVLPEYRHFGYGKALIDFCKEKVREFGGKKIVISLLDSHTVLKNWYTANGFTHTETKTFEHLPFPVGYMEWKIF